MLRLPRLPFSRHYTPARIALVCSGLAALVVFGTLTPFATEAAPQPQAAPTVITIAVSSDQKELFTNTIIPDFMKANPTITVQVVAQTSVNVASAASNVTTFLDAVQSLVSQSDVVLVNSNDVTAETTRAGYYLNMQPLLDTDQTLSQSDFYPNAFRAFQWDQGTWALPISIDATVLSYDTAAFDKAGLTYPTAKWTLDDLINAVKKLTITDASGTIVTPGIELFRGNNDIPLYMSLLGKPLYDAGAIPNAPNIDQPEVQTLLTNLNNLFAVIPTQSTTFNTAPIQIGSIRQLNGGPNNTSTRKGVLLPGGHAYLNVSGAAVSSSTKFPEAAYALVKFLTTRTDVSGGGPGGGPGGSGSYSARQSLIPTVTANTTPTGPGPNQSLTTETQKLYADAIANGYSATDRRFFDYLGAAITDMRTNSVDSKTAIANAQTKALQAEQSALTRKADASKVAVIATPIPTLAPNAGITLKFGISSNAGGPGGAQIPNQSAIQALADQFVQQNSGTVGRIDLGLLGNGPTGTTTAANFDCYYLPYSNVSSVALNTIINLDPYLTADATFNTSDFINGTLSQVTRDNKTWALPMNIQPTVMWYDPAVFANAGVPKPTTGWDVSAFNVALTGLLPSVATGSVPFAAQSDTSSTLLMLMAAYGGLPIDFRTTPVTVNFTDKANVDAMQQVLDMAKNKLINYQALASNFGFFIGGSTTPIYSQQLNGNNFRGGPPSASATTTAATTYVSVPFPKGSTYQMMAYSVGTLYISATAQNSDACYRWISMFAQHPELTTAMPARNSQLSAAALDTTVGSSLAAAYRNAGTILNDANTIGAPSQVGGFANFTNSAVQHWLFEAWDNYVLNGQDLTAGLTTAQSYATGFLQCYTTVPAYDSAQEKYTDYLAQVAKCIIKVDPRMSTSLGGIAGG